MVTIGSGATLKVTEAEEKYIIIKTGKLNKKIKFKYFGENLTKENAI